MVGDASPHPQPLSRKGRGEKAFRARASSYPKFPAFTASASAAANRPAGPDRDRRSGLARLRCRRDSRTRPSSMPIAARWPAGIEACVIRPGCSIRLSTPPRLSAKREHLAAFQESPSPGHAAVEHGRHHAAEGLHLPLGQGMLRMRRQARIVDLAHVAAALEPLGDLQRVCAMPLHPQRQRLQAAQRQKAVERPADRRRPRFAESRVGRPDPSARRRPPRRRSCRYGR